jgi:hypothetical protein
MEILYIYFMIEFNHTIWNNWILEGYRFIIFKDLNTHIILKPVKEVIEDEMLDDLEACIYGIREDEIYLYADNEENVKAYCEDINPY